MNLNLRNRNRTLVMDILYMQYTIIGVKKELLRLSLRLAQEFVVCWFDEWLLCLFFLHIFLFFMCIS